MKRGFLALAFAATVMAGSAHADSYPSRAMEWIVPSPAGGGSDTSARQMAKFVEKDLGQGIAIVNIAGGGGSVGMTQFLQAKPDGYTLIAIWNGPMTTVPNVQPVRYKLSDFKPIIGTSETAYVMCVKPDVPADNGKELIDLLKKNPGKYTYGNDGFGGTMHLGAERLFGAFGAKATPVPFGGAAETLKNFLGGHIDIYGGSVPPIRQYVEDGKAKCLLVTSAERNQALPNATSMGDLGRPDLAVSLWRAILGPKDMTDEQAKIIGDSVEKAVKTPEYLAFLKKRGEELAITRGEELRKKLQAEYESLGEVAASLGLKK